MGCLALLSLSARVWKIYFTGSPQIYLLFFAEVININNPNRDWAIESFPHAYTFFINEALRRIRHSVLREGLWWFRPQASSKGHGFKGYSAEEESQYQRHRDLHIINFRELK